MTAPPEAPLKAVDPWRRGWLWRGLQIIAQSMFSIWLAYRVRGIENLPQGGALLLINHQSFLDPLLIPVGLKRPVSYLARDSLFRIPLLGWLLRSTYVTPIRRESASTESIRRAIERLNEGYLVGLFPEGTRTDDGAIGEIKPGFLALVRRVQVPVIPAGIAGAFEALPRGAWLVRPRVIRVVFGKAIAPETIAELAVRGREAEFVKLVSSRISECTEEADAWRADG